ncbi:unnamed protein product [Heterobilharzia americana]|nr:unnamed protein product [Heterobilharzia americana]
MNSRKEPLYFSRYINSINGAKPTPKERSNILFDVVIFYRRFIPYCVQLVQQIMDLMRVHVKMLAMNDTTNEPFQKPKEALVSQTLLVHRDINIPLKIMTDAPNSTVRAVF